MLTYVNFQSIRFDDGPPFCPPPKNARPSYAAICQSLVVGDRLANLAGSIVKAWADYDVAMFAAIDARVEATFFISPLFAA